MNILNDDRTMLAKSVRALLSKRSGSPDVRAATTTPDRFDRDLWTTLCEQIGVGGLLIDVEHGGAAGSLIDAAVVAEELGRMLTPSPMLGTACLAATLLAASTDDDARARLLPGIATGATVVSACLADERGRWSGARLGVQARLEHEWTLTGTAHYVLDAGAADTFVVLATNDGAPGLFEVGAHAPGVAVSDGGTLDPTRALYRVTFDDANARPIAAADPVRAVDHALSCATVLLAAEQVGAAARCLELTVDYTTSRTQFGRPIGSFQALAHRMADLHVLVESARAAAYVAAQSTSERGTSNPDVSVAKVWCSDAFGAVAADCVQLHGGIAITWEHDMHLFFKRAHSSSLLFGSPGTHVAALAEDAGFPSELPPS